MRFVLLSVLASLPGAASGEQSQSKVHSQGQTPPGQAPQSQVSQGQPTQGKAQDLDREFQAAVAQYDSGQYDQAATRLERIVRQAPETFEVHELLGLVYSAQSQDARANPHLEKAVRLKPDSAAARTNLAANLMRLGKHDLAEIQFRKAVEIEPRNFDALAKRRRVQLIRTRMMNV